MTNLRRLLDTKSIKANVESIVFCGVIPHLIKKSDNKKCLESLEMALGLDRYFSGFSVYKREFLQKIEHVYFELVDSQEDLQVVDAIKDVLAIQVLG